MPSDLLFTRALLLWGLRNVWKSSVDHDVAGRKYTHSWAANWDYPFNQNDQQSRPCSSPQMSPFITLRTRDFPQVKVVATNLNVAEEALEAYQREKQQRLNELLVVIPLKLHQVTGLERVSRPGCAGEPPQPGFPRKDAWVTREKKCSPLLRILPKQQHPNFSYPFSDCWGRVMAKHTYFLMAHYHFQSPMNCFRSDEMSLWLNFYKFIF